MKKKEIVGNTYGELTVLEELPRIFDKTGRKVLVYKCQCSCGKTVVVKSSNLLSGNTKSCGCKNIEKAHQRGLNLLNETYGYLTVIEKISDRMWKCLCACGNTITTTTGALRSGNTKSCGCYQKKRATEANLHDLTGQKFWKLTVLRRISKEENNRNKRQTYYLCKCDCGNETVVNAYYLRTGETKSCGCLHSWGEHLVEKELKKYSLQYSKSHSFDDLLGPGGGKLLFDFCITNNDNQIIALIEYQGVQHFINSSFGRQQREITDKQKKQYCAAHNYKLFEIKYDEDIPCAVIDILHTIYANTVPSSESSEKV